MKASKLFVVVLTAGLGFSINQAFAQTDEQSSSDTPATTEESTSTDGTSTDGSSTEPYNETVTIDDGSASSGGSTDASTDTGVAPERKERLRVYSGKQDGNNVIVDPR